MKNFIIIILVLTVIFLVGCTSNKQSSNTSGEASAYRIITPEAAKALLDSKESLVLVDVRTAEEYAEKHIPGAILIPNENIGNTQLEQLSNLNDTIIVYCRSGRRSKEAADKLIKLGYTDIRDLGGILDWPYKTIAGSEIGVWENIGNDLN